MKKLALVSAILAPLMIKPLAAEEVVACPATELELVAQLSDRINRLLDFNVRTRNANEESNRLLEEIQKDPFLDRTSEVNRIGAAYKHLEKERALIFIQLGMWMGRCNISDSWVKELFPSNN